MLPFLSIGRVVIAWILLALATDGFNIQKSLVSKSIIRFRALSKEDILSILPKDSTGQLVSPYPKLRPNLQDATKVKYCYSNNFSVRTQLQSFDGLQSSLQYIDTWPHSNQSQSSMNSLDELQNSTFALDNIAITNNQIILSWNLTFFPSTIQSLITIANVLKPSCNKIYFDLLPYETSLSEFSWRRLFQFFKDLFIYNTARMPIAKIRGKTEISYTEEDETEVSSEETGRKVITFQRIVEILPLIDNINQRITQNRRLVLDLLEYLNSRRIQRNTEKNSANINEDINDFNALVLQKVRFSYIPNMNMMSIDGLNGEGNNQSQTSQVLNASNIVLSVFTSIVLLVGAIFTFSLLNSMFSSDSNYYIENRDYLG